MGVSQGCCQGVSEGLQQSEMVKGWGVVLGFLGFLVLRWTRVLYEDAR